MNRCPNGHWTSAADHCDICGAALTGTPGRPVLQVPDAATGTAPDPLPPPGAGADGTLVTGEADLPADLEDEDDSGLPDVLVPPPAGRWVVELWVDPAWHAESQSPDPLPSSRPPRTLVLTSRSALVGRPSVSRNIHPDVDCADDTGVSRRHAQLTTDGTRFWVEDLESANGTFVAGSGGALPTNPLPVGVKHELGADDRVYVGAWTRLVVRPATEDEQG